MKKILFLIFLLFFFNPQKTFAVTTTINSSPSTISAEPFTIEVSISGAGAGTNYIRTDFYKDGSTNYFGETYNGSSWYGGSDYTQYFPIVIQSGATASASFQARAGEPTTSEYDGTGNYKLRIRRYTSSGGYSSSEANNGAISININLSTPTPSPSPSASSISTPTSTPTPAPTNSAAAPKPTAKTPTPTSTPFATSISLDLGTRFSTEEGRILAATAASAIPSESLNPEIKTLGQKEDGLQKVFIILGILTIITSIAIMGRQWIKQIRQ